MTLADRVIDSLRHHHDRLAALVPTFDDAALATTSGATEWRVSDVLSHLGSGAEIMLRPVAAAAARTDVPASSNEAVWDRWNALAPRDQATGYVEHDERLVQTLEGFDHGAQESLRIDLGFLPEPVPLVVAAGMRLNEVVLHTWDVEVAFDPDAQLDPEASGLLLDLFAGPLSFLLGFTADPDQLDDVAAVNAGRFGLHLAPDAVELLEATPVAPTATFTGPHEALVRLLGGRLRPEHTPDDVEVTGNVSLDELRRVFPGF